MLETEHVLYVNKLYMVPSPRSIANFLIYGKSHKSMFKPTSTNWTAFNWEGIILTFKINPSEYQPWGRIPPSSVESNQHLRKVTHPIPKRWDTPQKMRQTTAGYQPSLSLQAAEGRTACLALLHSQLMNTDVQQDEAQPGWTTHSLQQHRRTAVLSIQVVLTLAGKNNPWVTGGGGAGKYCPKNRHN